MGTLHWYKRDPRLALQGMMHLTLEERGAYNSILDLIYMHDGKLRDDIKFVAAQIGTDIRIWRRLRARLLELKKLYVHGGYLRDEKADIEAVVALRRIFETSGTSSAEVRQKSGVGVKHINGLAKRPLRIRITKSLS
jgi:hypothetical protein